ncbi:hypothetical protein Ahy_A01g003895 [Arachis hypogaea]|uniref:chitinase n=1 Tax=Arachis hypogaea TaxID=3818 RepID=A0A445EUM4_ARAHY|nr:hypothetical protein Ahy_A01g003895 [Arachis hypogaea]
MGNTKLPYFMLSLLILLHGAKAEQCGRQANGALCPNSLCCSQWGWCGTTDPYCGSGCQSQCKGSTPSNPSPPPPPPTPIGGGGGGSGGGDVANILTSSMFDQMLKHRNDPSCPGKGFYTYDAFIAAARTSAGFGTTGDDATRKREIAAFLGQTSHETTGGWPSAPDGPYAWGYCFLSEVGATADYCVASDEWPCSPAGKAIGVDLLNNPDLVATNPTVSFLTALWFWMTPQGSKPSCHDVITGKWTPSDADKLAGRVPGFGVITNIINGGIECGHGSDSRVQDRIGFYQRYCQMLGVSPGDNLDCGNQRLLILLHGAKAEQCGKQANGALCPNSLCCSQFGWCGTTDPYCLAGCQSQCKGSTPTPSTPTPTPSGGGSGGDVANIITSSVFDQMLKYRNDPRCKGNGFYSYDAFIAAARSFGGFGTTGDDATRKREIAAFLAQTSHETTGGWSSAPDGPYAWGYCFLSEIGATADYCVASQQWPCSPAGKTIGIDLLNNPDLVTTNPTVSFKTAIWFWMTPQGNKPSSHDVITGRWTPSNADRSAGRVPGYGVVTNIINGGIECGHGSDSRVQDRIGFYQRYCQMLGVSPGDNLDCGNQKSFA